MRAFLSYSLKEEELYWVTLLAEQLQSQGIAVVTPNNMEAYYHQNLPQIYSSQFYIGLVTKPHHIERMLFEYNNAIRKIPAILVIDKNIYNRIRSNPSFKINTAMHNNIIVLSKDNLHYTISQIQHKIENIKTAYTQRNIAWVIGGAALIALLKSLSNDN